jgi:hypothetical protein
MFVGRHDTCLGNVLKKKTIDLKESDLAKAQQKNVETKTKAKSIEEGRLLMMRKALVKMEKEV